MLYTATYAVMVDNVRYMPGASFESAASAECAAAAGWAAVSAHEEPTNEHEYTEYTDQEDEE